MEDEFYLKIIRLDKTIYEGFVEKITMPGKVGEFTILKDFYNFIGLVKEGEVRLTKSGKEEKLFLKEGIVSFEKNKLIYIVG